MALPSTLKKSIKQIVRRIGGAMRGPVTHLPPEAWGLTYREGLLHYGETPLERALEQCGSPMHVVFEERLLENLKAFLSSTTSRGTRCDVFASYKTNPVPGVLKLLHAAGAAAEVISEYELRLALHLGVAPDRIVYNGPAKSDASLEMAVTRGIRAINLNHWDEVPRLRAIGQRLGRKINLGVRVTGRGWSGQFGFPMEDADTIAAIRALQEMPEFELIGFHCHRGYSIRSRADVADHLGPLLSFTERVRDATKFDPQMLDCGGSLAVPTSRAFTKRDMRAAMTLHIPPVAPDPNATLTPAAFTHEVIDIVESWFIQRGRPIPQIILEPGRSLTGNAQALLCRVLDIRRDRDFDYAILEVGASHARIMMDEYHEILPLAPRPGSQHAYRLVGPICHMGDVTQWAWHCSELRRGDALAIMDSGAYFTADAANFSFARPGVARIDRSGTVTLMRGTETFEYMTGMDRL